MPLIAGSKVVPETPVPVYEPPAGVPAGSVTGEAEVQMRGLTAPHLNIIMAYCLSKRKISNFPSTLTLTRYVPFG